MGRVLLLTFAFPPDNTASAARPGQLYDYLPDHGFQPVVIASTNFGTVEGSTSVQRVPLGRSPTRVAILSALGHFFMRYCAPYEDRLGWVPHAASAAARLLRAHPVDAVLSTSPSLAAHMTGLWIKKRFGLPWIADFQDPVRDNPFRTRKWIYPYDAILEHTLFRHADHLVANTDTVAEAWSKRYPHWANKISVVWNSFDAREAMVSKETTRPYRVLAHVGALYGARHPAQLLRSLDRLAIDSSSARVKLVGPIAPQVLAQQGPLFERMRAKGILEFADRLVPQDEAKRETAEADYLILLDINERNASFQVPSKLLSYIRVGKPILAYTPHGSPVEHILAGSGVTHVTIDPSASESKSDRGVAKFLSLPREVRRPSSWFDETFDARTQARIVADLLDDLLQTKSASARAGTMPLCVKERRVVK
jgi:Glycosyl transferase 4-like domain